MKTLLSLSSNLFGDFFSHNQERQLYVDTVSSQDETSNKHIIILHGWGKTEEDMSAWVNFMKNSSFSKDKTIWNIGYPSSLKFTKVADHLMSFFDKKKREGFNFEKVFFIGYSMGGIIARQMIANGFPVTKLVTVCSPHHGLNWFVPAVDEGVSSLKHTSEELKVLNANSKELSMRDRYLFCSIGYTINYRLGNREQDSDTMVVGKSARGVELEGDIKRSRTQIQYNPIKVEPGSPHLEGMNPENFADVLPFLTKEANMQQLRF